MGWVGGGGLGNVLLGRISATSATPFWRDFRRATTAASFAYSISASTMPGFQSMRSLLCALLAMVIVLCRDS